MIGFVVLLLLMENADDAKIMARQFDKMNQERKNIEAKMLTEAEEKVRVMREERGGDLSTLVIAGKGWAEGVIGLTASKLVERYNLPTIILTTQAMFTARARRIRTSLGTPTMLLKKLKVTTVLMTSRLVFPSLLTDSVRTS